LPSSDTGEKRRIYDTKTVHDLFIKFKKACDSRRRRGFHNILVELGFR
jgi:hypothetical protein